MAVYHEIFTDRLCLKPMRNCFIGKEYISWLNDSLVVKFSEQRHKNHTLSTCKAYVESFEKSSSFLWAIFVKDKDKHIGNISARIDLPNSIADIGILIGEKDYWGKGFATESFSAVVYFLLHDVNIRKITAGMISSNIGMRKVAEKIGMIPDGVRNRHYFFEGQEVDVIYYALFRENL